MIGVMIWRGEISLHAAVAAHDFPTNGATAMTEPPFVSCVILPSHVVIV